MNNEPDEPTAGYVSGQWSRSNIEAFIDAAKEEA